MKCFSRPGWIIVFLLGQTGYVIGQVSNVSGIINQYAAVLSIDTAANSITLASTAGFSLDDELLLIQMQGASMNSSNSSNFGNITNIRGAGNYELVTVCDVSGTQLTFQQKLVNTFYDPAPSAPRLQIVKFTRYVDAQVTGTLTAPAWDGQTGGVLVLAASGTITLNADIDVSGKGFRGGGKETMNSGCGSKLFYQSTAYFYDQASGEGAKKGEGIVPYLSNAEYGKGPQSSGGGGGNDHNTGGAGGGHYGSGGQGGTKTTGGIFTCLGNNPGLGGKALSGFINSQNRLFLGGGGGAGHDNDSDGENGGNGGGIVILIGDQLAGNNQSILANGMSPASAGGDGGAGGGAGGAVSISVNAYGPNPFTIEVEGGDGGQAGIGSNCLGPGGGGAGGSIRVATPLPGYVSTSVAGGAAGTINAGVSGCAGATNGAGAGQNGSLINSLSIPAGTQSTPCILGWQPGQNFNQVPLAGFSVSLYPNPALKGQAIHVNIGQTQPGPVSLQVYDAWGKRVWQESWNLAAGRHTQNLALHHLPAGAYYFRVWRPDAVRTLSWIKPE